MHMNQKFSLKKISILCVSALVLSACSMAPKYEGLETLPVSKQYPNQSQISSNNQDIVNLGWKSYFADPRLQQLIDLSLENNRDLRIAASPMEETQKNRLTMILHF